MAEREHRICDLDEAGDIGTGEVVDMSIAFAEFDTALVDIAHCVLEQFFQFVFGPGDTRAVLTHFQSGHGHAPGDEEELRRPLKVRGVDAPNR